jgi:hypothetical protein
VGREQRKERGEGRRREKRKGREKKKGEKEKKREKEREREITSAPIAATVVHAWRSGDTQHVARNEEKEKMGQRL